MPDNNILNNESVTFEAAMTRLEEIVRALESGNAPLDESLEMFEEGVSLVKLCNSRLDSAEQKVRLLVSEGNKIAEKDFTPSGNG